MHAPVDAGVVDVIAAGGSSFGSDFVVILRVLVARQRWRRRGTERFVPMTFGRNDDAECFDIASVHEGPAQRVAADVRWISRSAAPPATVERHRRLIEGQRARPSTC